MGAETNDFIVIENEGIAPPLLLNRAADADGKSWADGKIHADKIFLPAKTDGVTDNNGNTLTQLLARTNATTAAEILAREEADNEINKRVALIEAGISEGGNSGGGGLSLQTTEAVMVIPLEMLSPDMTLFTLTGKGVLRSYRLNSDFLGRTYVKIDGRDMGGETENINNHEYWFQEKAEIIFDGFLDGRGFGTFAPPVGAVELTVVYYISI